LPDECRAAFYAPAKPQPTNDLMHIGVKKCSSLAAVFVDFFAKNKCNFLHKHKLDIVRRVQFLTGRRPIRSFCPGAVATIAVWNSAPMPESRFQFESAVFFCFCIMTIGLTVVSNRHTQRDRPRYFCSKRPHLCTLRVRAMCPNTTTIVFNHICSAL